MTVLRNFQLRLAQPTAVVSLVLGIALLPVGGTVVHIAGYCLSCLIPFVLIAGERRAAMREQTERGVVRDGRERWVAVAVLGAGLLVGGVHAWMIAWSLS